MNHIPHITNIHGSPTPKRPVSRPSFSALFASGFNLPFIVIVVLLVAYGLLVCWSATTATGTGSIFRQMAGVAIGALACAFIWRFDYRKLAGFTSLFLIVTIVLVLLPHLPFIGVEVNGARSWLKLGMQFQPGEFAKITVVLFAASLVARYEGTLDNPREYLKTLSLLCIPFVCIMTQPDLGTGLVYLFISGAVLVMGGARVKYLVITLIALIVLVAAVFALDEMLKYQLSDGTFEYRLLKNYQRNRLLVFLNPEGDLSGEGYNLAQAKIAIGSGGLFGVGLFNGTQAAYGYLPEAQTDFIFCVLCQELGFVGAFFLLLLYAALIFITIRIARNCDNLFGMLVCCAIVSMWMFQILENMGMTCGLMPITGIPLPFVSFGTSFMITNFVMLGLVGSISSHRSMVHAKG